MSAWLADLLVVLHFSFVVFVVLGGLLALLRPGIAWLHLPAAAWGAWIEFAGWVCPLTPLENRLRARAGGAGAYETTFVEHYVVSLLYPSGLTRDLQWALGGLVVAVNAVIYYLVWRRTQRRRSRMIGRTLGVAVALLALGVQTPAQERSEVRAAIGPGRSSGGSYDFSTERRARRRVSDTTFRRAVAAFGEERVVDLIGVMGSTIWS